MVNLSNSVSFQRIMDHREKCPKWGKEFCLGCFGGGIHKFMRSLVSEGLVKLDIKIRG